MLIQSRYDDIPRPLIKALYPVDITPSRCTELVENLIREDSMSQGCEIALTLEDDAARQDLDWCCVCEDMYHRKDLAPCGPSPRTCASCVESYPGDVGVPYAD